MMADAARYNVDRGAQIIDINMGCPAKKICNVMAGSALLRDEPLVARILEAVVSAVPTTPVTLKIRTGWDRENRNALRILKIAEESGIRALAMHGRTRACGYSGEAEYETIRQVKAAARIPVIANGDIDSPEKAKMGARQHRRRRGDDRPRSAGATLAVSRDRALPEHRQPLLPPRVSEIHEVLLGHLDDVYLFYGRQTGVGVARKHISWYTRGLLGSAAFRHRMNQLPTVEQQRQAVDDFFLALADDNERLPATSPPEDPATGDIPFEELAA
jgi:tRNA-dihydrouridine synthase B